MSLSEYLRDFRPSTIIHLGCIKGSGFIYEGTVDGFYNGYVEIAGGKHLQATKFLDRDVVEHYPSELNRTETILLISGREHGPVIDTSRNENPRILRRLWEEWDTVTEQLWRACE